MTTTTNLSRRGFLSALVVIPAASSLLGCAAQLDPEDDDVDAVASNATSYPTYDLKKHCGARGDGRTNDTSAFQKAAALLEKARGGTLVIPAGTYIVGRQKKKTNSSAPGPFYDAEDVFAVSGLKSLTIKGYGAKLKVAGGLHFGGFDPKTGKPIDSTGAKNERANVGRILQISECDDVAISGLEIDGNCTQLVLGGQSGNEDRQGSAAGVWLNKNKKAKVLDVHTHHHAVDGITVLHLGAPPSVEQMHTLKRVVSEYNGRQAISWIGGWGLTCIDCKFNHTGRAVNHGGGQDDGKPLASLPKAGLDIEPNAGTNQVSKGGRFVRCEFVNNAGPGILASVGDGGWTSFEDCTIWGTTSYSLYLRQPGLKFLGCDIYGTAKNTGNGHTGDSKDPNPKLATLFEDCNFEDKEWTDGKVSRMGALYDVGTNSQGATWRNCTFTNHKVQSVYATSDTQEIFEGCSFISANAGMGNGGAQATFVGSKITSCHFSEAPEVSRGSRNYRIEVRNVTVGRPAAGAAATKVDGPRVKWNSAGGLTGVIKPGTYA